MSLFLAAASLSTLSGQTDWPVYGHDPGGMKYSPLDQINTNNVSGLVRAWTYHSNADAAQSASAASTSARGGRARPRPVSEATPLVIDNVMYLPTAYNTVVALEPETGKEIWKYKVIKAQPAMRGVSYWPGDKLSPAEILFGTSDGRLICLNAKTGKPVPGFGIQGELNLKTGVADKYPDALYSVSSTPIIHRDLVMVGAQVQEVPSQGPAGDVRAWDVHTGKLAWTFHTVPRAGEPGNETWAGDSWKERSGTNAWAPMTLDSERGLLFLPLGQPSYDNYGADRKGLNLYGDCVVALDASTGKLRWYYQFVHHDIWDYDTPAPPVLIDVVRDGKTIPAIAQITKMGLLFILDRLTGKPIFGAEERPVPKTDVPGEESWPTQPFPLKPKPLARNSFKKDEIATVTAEHQEFCTQLFNTDGGMYNAGPYTPFQTKVTLLFPGKAGGGNWGGVSFDPKLGYIFVNTQDLGEAGAMVKAEEEGASPAYHKGGTLGPFSRFWDPKKEWPCQQPPWGRLSAINANTGDVVWQIPFGIVDELEAKGVRNTGSPNAGGSVVTAGHLLFIAATTDHRFRAFDSRTGKQLWETKLEAGGHATPITYLGRNGKQYVLITAGGGFSFDHVGSDSVAAFALP